MKKEIIMLLTFIILIFFFCGCVNNPNQRAENKTLYVDDDGFADYTVIQQAIDDSIDGDTIFVYSGTYNENLIITKSIDIIGEDKNSTIISYLDYTGSTQFNIIEIVGDKSRIENFTIKGPGYSKYTVGIYINSSENRITNNIIFDLRIGVFVWEYSKNNTVSNNDINGCVEGISLRESDGNEISKNKLYSCTMYGLYLIWSDNNIIKQNNVTDNNFYGIRIKGSDNNNVFRNEIINNKNGLLCCCGAGNNIIYLNQFVNNSEYNGKDDVVNQWYNDEYGNYWDDYTGVDEDEDGFGDTPYNITGMANSQDIKPLMNPIYFYTQL